MSSLANNQNELFLVVSTIYLIVPKTTPRYMKFTQKKNCTIHEVCIYRICANFLAL